MSAVAASLFWRASQGRTGAWVASVRTAAGGFRHHVLPGIDESDTDTALAAAVEAITNAAVIDSPMAALQASIARITEGTTS